MAEPATVEIEVKGETPTPKKQPERGCNKKGWAAVAGLVIIGGLVVRAPPCSRPARRVPSRPRIR